ncbi:hypothetical protein C5N14_15065 [Micromonospora sp. MW-13]|uniref:hypothetical protein n=1 Tax=Micromonospora sp. MW-13 TaxID=2094022 RepID=UPI000ECDC939|nr:hypothetical protein [Micromonospora sp. MW-13]RGC68237.1 hypothetical protein C5N14_15065 [Micromonospora sp. MW-13]
MPRPTNDSWIAACCLVDRLPLATFNGREYAEYDGLRLPPWRRPGPTGSPSNGPPFDVP